MHVVWRSGWARAERGRLRQLRTAGGRFRTRVVVSSLAGWLLLGSASGWAASGWAASGWAASGWAASGWAASGAGSADSGRSASQPASPGPAFPASVQAPSVRPAGCDLVEQGCPLTLGRGGQAVLDDPSLSHVWRLSIAEPTDVWVGVVCAPGGAFRLYVYGPDRELAGLAEASGCPGIRLSPATPGEYQAIVDSPDGSISPSPYRIYAFRTQATAGTVIWSDPLDDPAYGTLTVTPPRPEQEAYRYQDGAYVMELRQPGVATSTSLPMSWRGTLQVEAWLPTPVVALGPLLECGIAGEDYRYRLAVDPERQQWRLRRTGNGEQILVDWQAWPGLREGSEFNRLELTCAGTQLAAAINGIEVARMEVEAMRGAEFFVGVSDLRSSAGGEARFRNLEFVYR
jgi:hypothetical protein